MDLCLCSPGHSYFGLVSQQQQPMISSSLPDLPCMLLYYCSAAVLYTTDNQLRTTRSPPILWPVKSHLVNYKHFNKPKD